jgi:hypothetical protein
MLAMKRPPAGPPTPMPRSRRVSWRWGMGLSKIFNRDVAVICCSTINVYNLSSI